MRGKVVQREWTVTNARHCFSKDCLSVLPMSDIMLGFFFIPWVSIPVSVAGVNFPVFPMGEASV